MSSTLVSLMSIFIPLSLLSFGGGNTILPELIRQTVYVHHWVGREEFNALYAMSQAAPGPNLMIVPLIGWHVAGVSGLLVVSLAKFLPSSVIAYYCSRVWYRYQDHPVRYKIQQAILPVTAGLITAGALAMCTVVAANVWLISIMVLSSVIHKKTSLPPLLILVVGGLTSMIPYVLHG